MVVVMDKGEVKWVGSSDDLKVSIHSAFCSVNELSIASQVENGECITKSSQILVEKDEVHSSEEVQEIVETEFRKQGRVELIVYK